ncbi:MAG: inositol monophosphatase [Candidatus Saccharimonadales bacterium]
MRQFLEQILSEASEIAKNYHGHVSAEVKTGDNNQVLTEADIEIGKHLVAKIQEVYPDINIIDEEAGVIDKGSNITAVIDPIDGTSNFANGLPHFGIMVGVLEDGRPVAGAAALPAMGLLYSAAKGEGAFCNGKQVRVSVETELLNSLVAYGIDGHQENPSMTFKETQMLAGIVLAIRNLRSSNSVYDMAMVASGEYGGFLNQTTKIWDNVAMEIIIQEAGGLYTDFWGEQIDYSNGLANPEANYTVCAASPALHQQLQTIIHQR